MRTKQKAPIILILPYIVHNRIIEVEGGKEGHRAGNDAKTYVHSDASEQMFST